MSYAHAHNLPRHPPILPKTDAEELAADVLEWFGRCLRWLAPESWAFAVDPSGKYLAGECSTAEPMPFMFDHDSWELTLRCTPLAERVPHRREELTQARERLHKAVTIVIMNLTSSAKAGKMLAQLRKDHGLKKLRRADIL